MEVVPSQFCLHLNYILILMAKINQVYSIADFFFIRRYFLSIAIVLLIFVNFIVFDFW